MKLIKMSALHMCKNLHHIEGGGGNKRLGSRSGSGLGRRATMRQFVIPGKGMSRREGIAGAR